MGITITVYEQVPENESIANSGYITLKREVAIIDPYLKEKGSRYVVYDMLPKK